MSTASKALSASAVSAAGGLPARTSSPLDACTSVDTSKLGSCSIARRTKVAFHDGLGSCTSTLSRSSARHEAQVRGVVGRRRLAFERNDPQRDDRGADRRRRVPQRRVEALGVARPLVLQMRELGATLFEDDPRRLAREPARLDDSVERRGPAHSNGIRLVCRDDAHVRGRWLGDGDSRDRHVVTQELRYVGTGAADQHDGHRVGV